MPDYSDHDAVLQLIADSQKADNDNRERVREIQLFLNKRDGQWEQEWWDAADGRPRYTFDMTNPIVDQITGDIEKADFDIQVKPAGGDASKDTAQILDGIVRNIENISNATNVFNMASRNMVAAGFDCWRVNQRYIDDDSFDQDLIIEPIANSVDRVWFDIASELQDRSDARWCVVAQGLTKDEYKEKFPDGSEFGMGSDRSFSAYWKRPDLIMVGQLYYKKESMRTLVLMDNGASYEDNDEFKKIADDLQAMGINEVERRERKKHTVYSRKFDDGGWLTDEEETVFEWLPVIPTYGNYRIIDNKVVYWGAVDKVLDSQRVYNYAMSRQIEETALAPRAKYWMTAKQVAGYEDTIQTLNTNNDPVQIYNHDPENPGPPQQSGGAQINPGLQVVTESSRQIMAQTAGLFAASMGDNPNVQSGIAIEKLQDKGDTGTIKYFSAQETAICHTGRVLIDAIPKVYKGERLVRILNEDGSFDMTALNQPVRDEKTGEIVVLNDLSVGVYDVTCKAGPSFKNRQSQTVSSMVEVAAVDPSIIQMGGDILLNSVTSPGFSDLAERKREQLFKAGLIPKDQMTDAEKQKAIEEALKAQQEGGQPDPATVIAQAEQQRVQVEAQKAQVDAQESQIKLQQQQQQIDNDRERIALDRERNQLDMLKAQVSLQQSQQKADNEGAKVQQSQQVIDFNQLMTIQKQQMEQVTQLLEDRKTMAETLKTIKDAMGVDTIVGPGTMEAYVGQADKLNDSLD